MATQPIIITFTKGALRDYSSTGLSDGFVRDARHVYFEDGAVHKRNGISTYFNTEDVHYVNGLYRFKEGNTIYTLSGTKTNMSKIVNGTKTLLKDNYNGFDTQDSFTDATPWSIVSFGNVILYTNGVDVLQKLVPSYTTVSECGGNPPLARVVKEFHRHVMLLGLTVHPRKIAWSDIDDYEMWTSTSTNEAGDYDFYSSDTPIISGETIGDFFGVYSEDKIYMMQYVGGTFVFSTRNVAQNMGLWKKMLLASIGDMHFFMSKENFYSFDGVNKPSPIGDGNKYDIFASINKDQISRGFAFPNTTKSEVWFVLPTGTNGYPNLACIFNYGNGTWTFEDLEMWSGIDSGQETYPLYSGADKKLYNINVGNNSDDGSAITGTIETAEYHMGLPNIKKEVHEIYPICRSTSTSLKIKVGYRNSINDAITWTPAKTFNPASDYKVDFRHEASRYIRFKIYSDGVDTPFSLDQIIAFWEVSSGR
jgi:hypothetical protein